MRVETYNEWLRRFLLPSVVLTAVVIIWSISVGVLVYRVLGVTISTVNGLPATFTDEVILHGLDGTVLAFGVHCLILLGLFVCRATLRLWLSAALLIAIGSPIALLSGWHIAQYLWALNQRGTLWEGLLPQPIGVVSMYVLSALIAAWLNRYRVVIVRRDDARLSPCPKCGYDLYGSRGQCPECGWVLPPARRESLPPPPSG